jgi:hypothetical protein
MMAGFLNESGPFQANWGSTGQDDSVSLVTGDNVSNFGEVFFSPA